MASLHFLEQSDHEVRVVAHIAVPAGNNSAGIPWQTAVARLRAAAPTILPEGDGTAGTITAAEKAQLVAGELVETVDTIRTDSVTGGAAAVNAYLDAQFARIQSETLARLQQSLKYYGGTR